MSPDAYAGVRRRKQTPWRVKIGDALVSRFITIGGMGTIAAVMLVVLVLLASAWPLSRSPEFSNWSTLPIQGSAFRQSGLDEYGLIVWGCDANGKIVAYSAHDGSRVSEFTAPEADKTRTVTATFLTVDRSQLVLGFDDGTIQSTPIAFRSQLLAATELPEGLGLSSNQPIAVADGAIFQLFDDDDVRKVEFVAPQWTSPSQLAEAPILALDFVPPSTSNQFSQQTSSLLVAVTSSELVIADISSKENLLTGEVTQELSTRKSALMARSKNPPLAVMVANRGTQALVAWDLGTIDRYAIEGATPQLAESASGLPGGGHATCATALLGRQTLLVGDSQGYLHGWMIVQQSDSPDSSDDYMLAEAHRVRLSSQPVEAVSSSSANHVALARSNGNELALVMVTTDSLLKKASLPVADPQALIGLSSKNDRVFALGSQQATLANLDIAYPEATLRGLFGYVWYEGHSEPKAIWQSSAGTEMSEPKLSLLPLIFGTLKATVYAMVFSVPLAILAAIYTSEFLQPKMRSRVKPLIEMMASLPSVVLGFIAALVLAPLLQQHLCAVLLSIAVIPLTFVFAAHLWNLLPLDLIVRLQSWRLCFLALCVPTAIWIASCIAPTTERLLFSGDITQWLSGSVGSGIGAWMLLLIPVVTVSILAVLLGPLAERDRKIASSSTPLAFAIRGLIRLILVVVVILTISWVCSYLLSSIGLDPRGSFFRGYQERNSLLVGAVLGFCVIPLIYTLADDALQSVPQQLRSASLGCGATPWQTTVRVVVPSAMSGMFSAVMIGLGRAVGETMVVLMAAGNTPILEWNPFNGFRTLSATLATELPEAAKGSTHYRTLFLAALLLFVLTLLANTVAEFVRIRFRKRASQL